MLKKILKPKGWLIVTGLIHLVMGCVVQLTMSADVAEMGWGKEAVAAHDAFYEGLMATFIFPHVVIMFAAAFLFSGQVQARIAAIFGGALVVNFVGAAVHGSGVGYMAEMGTAQAFAPPIVMFSLLALSGVLYWNTED